MLGVTAVVCPTPGYALDDLPLEIDGNILNGGEPPEGCSDNCPAQGPDVDPATDWGDLFEVVGDNVEPVHPLPDGGRVAAFTADCIRAGGLKDCTVFARDNTNLQRLETWEFKSGDTPPKDDLSNVYAYLWVKDGREILCLGLERATVRGNSHVDFDIKSNPVGLEPSLNGEQLGPICNGCDIQGRFVGSHSIHDVLVAVDFENGGRVAGVTLYGYAEFPDGVRLNEADAVHIPAEETCSTDVCADTNDGDICGGPWRNFDGHGDVISCIPHNGFSEMCIDVTDRQLGEICLSNIIVKTRSSAEINAELKDFAILKFDTCSDIEGFKVEVPGPGCPPPVDFEPDCEDVIGPLNGWEVAVVDVTDPANPFLPDTDGNGDPLENPMCTGEHPDDPAVQGYYRFANLPNGRTYRICEVLPDTPAEERFVWAACPDIERCAGPTSSCADVAVPIIACSAFYPDLGGTVHCQVDPIDLEENEQVDLVNFKVQRCTDLLGAKYCDENGDGIRQPDEPGLPDRCIVLTQFGDPDDPDDDVVQVTTTAADGSYVFEGLQCGERVEICEDPDRSDCDLLPLPGSASWVQTGPKSDPRDFVSVSGFCFIVDVPCEQDFVDGLNFGNTPVPEIDCPPDDELTADPQDAVPCVDVGECHAHACYTINAETASCAPPTIECVAETSGGAPVDLTTTDTRGTREEDGVIFQTLAHEICGDFPAGCPEVTTVTCTVTTPATDNVPELTDTCSFTVTVEDTLGPVITCPPDATLPCEDPNIDPANTGRATAEDNCDSDPEIDYGDVLVDDDPCHTVIRRTWTATDDCGNKCECDQLITIIDDKPPEIDCPTDYPCDPPRKVDCDEKHCFNVTATDNCDPNPTVECTFDKVNPERVVIEPGDHPGAFCITLTGTASVKVTCVATDWCDLKSEECVFCLEATCEQACSPGFWKNNLSAWCQTDYDPDSTTCGSGPATKFVDAFELTDFSAKPGFDKDMTLLTAVNQSGGDFNQTLFHCSAALLSASHPDVGFPASVSSVIVIVQQAFAGDRSFADAFNECADLNDAEKIGGCPLSGGR